MAYLDPHKSRESLRFSVVTQNNSKTTFTRPLTHSLLFPTRVLHGILTHVITSRGLLFSTLSIIIKGWTYLSSKAYYLCRKS